MRLIEYIAIHSSATRENQDYSVEQLTRDHIERGFATIGYHYYITKDGIIHKGRPIERMGAHVKGYNLRSIGICYEGGLDKEGNPKDTRTGEQKIALKNLLMIVLDKLNRMEEQNPDKVVIKGHREFPNVNKECPCFNANQEYKYFTGEAI